MPPDAARPKRIATPALGLLLAAATVGTYTAWPAWDEEYQLDPDTGVSSGPYEAWQVVGCALTIGVLAVVAGLLQRPGVALGVVPLVLTVAWSRHAAANDDSGLWAVGALLVLVGSLAAVAALAYAASALVGRRPGPPST